jgi:AhpD family alkylhydroperoxidase
MTPRLPIPSGRTRSFGRPEDLAIPDPSELAPEVCAAHDRVQAESFSLSAIGDPVLIEMVRLRNARFQNCRFCQSTRSAAARALGADEQLYDSIDDYESSGLSERQKAALRLADAYLLSPGEMAPSTRQGALEHFRPQEIVEIVLRLMEYSSDKIMVALKLDLNETKIMTE